MCNRSNNDTNSWIPAQSRCLPRVESSLGSVRSMLGELTLPVETLELLLLEWIPGEALDQPNAYANTLDQQVNPRSRQLGQLNFRDRKHFQFLPQR